MKTTTDHDIREYGAAADGKTVNTKAIQAAVDACAAVGGGRVVVPAGTFISGSIFLKSNVEFHLLPGAVLLGSPDLADFALLDVEGLGYHVQGWLYAALLTACKCENVSVTGAGIVDGNGPVWWVEKDRVSDFEAAFRKAGKMKSIRPPNLLFFDCRRVKVRDVKLMNSPMYAVLPIFCRDVVIDGISIESPWMPYNNCDGIDLMSCKDVRVSNCHVDTGDDGICLKTVPGWCMLCGPGEKGEGGPDYSKPRIPCDNVVIENCVVRRAHTGVAIWAEVLGGMSNVVVSNCVFDGTRNGIQIARYPWIGGYVKNCSFTNIVMRSVGTAILVSTEVAPWQKLDEGPGRETSPEFHNIRIAHVAGTKVHVACQLLGTEKNPVQGIDLSHLRIESDLGVQLGWVRDVRLEAIDLRCQNVPLAMRDSANVEVTGFNAKPSTPEIPVLEVERVQDVWIHGCTAAAGTGTFLGEVGAGNGVLLEHNRLARAACERGAVDPENRWNTCSHAYTGSRWIRDSGARNIWLPMPEAVDRFVRARWTPEQVDGIYSVSRVEANSRDGAEVPAVNPEDFGKAKSLHNVDRRELRRIYIIESRHVAERLVVFEDGELLRTVSDPDFHPHYERRQRDHE